MTCVSQYKISMYTFLLIKASFAFITHSLQSLISNILAHTVSICPIICIMLIINHVWFAQSYILCERHNGLNFPQK